jgi:hypothetical protein
MIGNRQPMREASVVSDGKARMREVRVCAVAVSRRSARLRKCAGEIGLGCSTTVLTRTDYELVS